MQYVNTQRLQFMNKQFEAWRQFCFIVVIE